ncbi:MAG: hypothetical protein ABOK23_08205 [Candidatus Methanoperedens sp.]|nr:hypothetical protein [Candidatus Methanoperedens sp.]
MDPKNKTLIPLIIIFFIFGIAVGYVAHKPVTIEKIVTVTVTPIPTPTPTPTSSPAPTPSPTPAQTAAPNVSDFIVKDYFNPSIDIPTYTIQLRNFGYADPNSLYIHQGESVLIKITDTSLAYPMTIILNSSYSKNLGVSGAAFVTFNNKGKYSFKAIIPSSQIGTNPRTYAEGTITVY